MYKDLKVISRNCWSYSLNTGKLPISSHILLEFSLLFRELFVIHNALYGHGKVANRRILLLNELLIGGFKVTLQKHISILIIDTSLNAQSSQVFNKVVANTTFF